MSALYARLTCRQLWTEEKQALCTRLEEYQGHEQALNQELTAANNTSKKVCVGQDSHPFLL